MPVENESKVIFLLGPTASGKTQAALHLTEHFPLEIISVDSAQIYRGMDIGTAKLDAATLRRFPHHLIDIIDPTETYSVAAFRQQALEAIADIHRRGRVPLLAGGTMLYVKALANGLSALPAADPLLRTHLEQRAAEIGWPALHGELQKIDPVTAARLEPGDAQRIQRALEVFELTGQPLSALQKRAEKGASDKSVVGEIFPYRVLNLALQPSDRAILHQRVAQRFDAMLERGLVNELIALRQRYSLGCDMPSMRCVGYRQTWRFLEGECSAEELREQGIAATRQLVKRQLTWLRSMRGMLAFDCLRADLLTVLANQVEMFLAA